ncbi:MAG: NADH-quinone oxidoreductase subunit A [Firmicutes bacterium]|nr:NADH-quinone oxidoreductase subunit A [Bacillota bacterium]
MITQYGALLIYVLVAFLVAYLVASSSQHMGPKAPGGLKRVTYESGIVPEAPVKYFSVRFYRVAMFFMIFDVAVMSLYPWATSLRSLHQAGMLRVLAFLAIVGLAFFYVWNRGGFQWD